jgi:hypothetical protein
MTFKKGQSGNPKGRVAVKEQTILRDMCRGYVKKSLVILKEIIENTALKESARVSAIKLVWEYAYGKPIQPIAIEEFPEGAVTFLSSSKILEKIQVLEKSAANDSITRGKKKAKK